MECNGSLPCSQKLPTDHLNPVTFIHYFSKVSLNVIQDLYEKLSDEFNFGPYRSNITSALRKDQMEIS
jgi:hypothetical protein